MLAYGDPPQGAKVSGAGPIRIEVDPESADLVSIFLDNRRSELPRLRRAVDEGDAEVLGRMGHRMKGMGGSYGFDFIARVGAAMERLAYADRVREANAWIDGLEEYLDRVEPVAGDPE